MGETTTAIAQRFPACRARPAEGRRRHWGAQVGAVVATLVWWITLTGCPPTGDAPPFLAGHDVDPGNGSGGRSGDGGGIRNDTDPTADARVNETGVAPACVDRDGDGYVEGVTCALAGGDCDPDNPTIFPMADELCNGLDDDCDLEIDEGNPGGDEPCDTGLEGVCAAGLQRCEEGRYECQPEARSIEETCNGLDDDCDGQIDEENAGGGSDCDTEVPGACSAGTKNCIDGTLICMQRLEPVDEVCNGLDDNCDGQSDEENPGGGGECDTGLQGLCGIGVERCSTGVLVCVIMNQPVAERCNGLDDNCNGVADETWAGRLGQPCLAGTGECQHEGQQICAEDFLGVICDAIPGEPVGETCNHRDDDCDGDTDEGLGVGDPCDVGQGACLNMGHRICVEDAVAGQSQTRCDVDPGVPSPELCNGRDDDCDDEVDEDFPDLGQPCVDESGACPSPGIWICNAHQNGQRCDAEPILPNPEICNDLDDDCDGDIDEDFPDKGAPCGIGVGACARVAQMSCREDGTDIFCPAVEGEPIDELCDGLDNDCDGRIDNRAPCPSPPTGVLSTLAIAPEAHPRCRDWNGDGVIESGLSVMADRFNDSLAESIAERWRQLAIRARDVDELGGPAPDGGQADPLTIEFVEVRGVTDDTLTVDTRSIDAIGRARSVLGGLLESDGVWSGGDEGAPLWWISPLFFDRDSDRYAYSHIWLHRPRFRGRLEGSTEQGLRVTDGVLTGAIDRAALLDAYQRAADACGAIDNRPSAACGVFGEISVEQIADSVIADVDLDEDGVPESVSACLLFDAVPAPDLPAAPVGGQQCAVDSDCLAGLVCRPVPTVDGDDPESGAALAYGCGVPGSGRRDLGIQCRVPDDCQLGLCGRYTARPARCTTLCEHSDDCPDGFVCRGVAVDVEGALNRGGASARLCVPVAGSGLGCTGTECPRGEICAMWLSGEVGEPGGRLVPEGACQIPDPGAPLGLPCESAMDCVHGNGCVADYDGIPRCLAPCTGTPDCLTGQVCLDRPFVSETSVAEAVRHGFCVPLPPEIGSGLPCDGDLGCSGSETCLAHVLEVANRVDRYCVQGQGVFSVGQPCLAGGDCASGLCSGGFCSGICTTHDDCTAKLGCRPNAVFEHPEGADEDRGRVLGGLCEVPSADCVFDRDCVADPVCGEGRCVCGGNQCHVGCRDEGFPCPAGLFCQPDNTCAPFCHDDPAEPNDFRAQAKLIEVNRTQPVNVALRRLCLSSPIDWYEIRPQGQPFQIRVSPAGGDLGALLDVELFNALGASLAVGEPGDMVGERVVGIRDLEAAQAFAQSPVRVRVRGASVSDTFDYQMVVEILFSECAEDANEPQDESWQWTPLAAMVGQQAVEDVDAWICPQDVDWYAVFVGNGDVLNLELDIPEAAPGHESVLTMRLIGPDFPELGAPIIQEVAVGAVEPGGPAVLNGRMEFTPERKFCNRGVGPFGACAFENTGDTLEICTEASFCRGSTYFVEVRGADSFDYGQYRLSAQVLRQAPLNCVPDAFERDDVIDLPDRLVAGLGAPNIVTVRGSYPTLRPDTDVLVRHARCCTAGDIDSFTFYYEAGETLTAELRQIGNTEHLTLAVLEAADTSNLIDEVSGTSERLRVQTVIPMDDYIAVAVLGVTPNHRNVDYELILRRERADHAADRGCDDAELIALNPLTGRAVVTDTTAEAWDDHRPFHCFGAFGPDRTYRVQMPGPGFLMAQVRATSELDGYDPAVSIRAICEREDTELACNEDDLGAVDPFQRAVVSTPVSAGEIYVIVDSFSDDTPGQYELVLTFQPE